MGRGNLNVHQWKSQLITVAVITSVFTGGYYVYDRYRFRRQNNENNENEEEEGDNEEQMQRGGALNYLLSFFSPKFDNDDADENGIDSAITPFQFLGIADS